MNAIQFTPLIGIAVAVIHVLSVRKSKEQNPQTPDGLTGSERFIFFISLLLGGLLIPALVYYFGLKDVFPTKARQIVKMVFILFGLFVVSIVLLVTLVTYSMSSKRAELRTLMQQQNEKTEQLRAELRDM